MSNLHAIVFGKVIQAFRVYIDITQADLANASEMSRASINAIENGAGNPELTSILAISKALKISLADMFAVFEASMDIASKEVKLQTGKVAKMQHKLVVLQVSAIAYAQLQKFLSKKIPPKK